MVGTRLPAARINKRESQPVNAGGNFPWSSVISCGLSFLSLSDCRLKKIRWIILRFLPPATASIYKATRFFPFFRKTKTGSLCFLASFYRTSSPTNTNNTNLSNLPSFRFFPISHALEAMSLACLACHGVESSPEVMRSYSSRSDTEVTCCWARKSPPPPSTPEPSATAIGSKVAPAPSRTTQIPLSPRLTRCHAVRRDLFNDWNFEEMMADGRHLCMNLSGRS